MRAVLTYHSVDCSGSAISVTPEAFRAHVEWMNEGSVRVVSLADLLTLPDEVDALALTFDDALASVEKEAAPVLAVHGFPATVFVVSRHVGGDTRWADGVDPDVPVLPVLGWGALARLRAQGFAIGAHTRHHRKLTACGVTELADELAGSADDIARALDERPATFAYPYGKVDVRVARAAAQHFAIACTTAFRPVSRSTRPELVPRLDAWYFRDPARLREWGTPGFRRAIVLRRALRQTRSIFR